MPCNVTEHTVPQYSISDHLPICITRKLNDICESGPVHNSISYRDTRQLDEDNRKKISLGVTIDYMLNFDLHDSDICKKAAKQINVLCRLSQYLTTETKLLSPL